MNDQPQFCLLLVFVLALTLSACATNSPAPVADRAQRVERDPLSRPARAADDVHSPPVVAVPTKPAINSLSPAQRATRQLLASVDADIAARNFDAAAANVDRAIHIAPEDPRAWYELAKLHFARGDYLQAKATAQRSKALSGATSRLVAANWFLIADIERIYGDEAAADQAYTKARALLDEAAAAGSGNQGEGGTRPFKE